MRFANKFFNARKYKPSEPKTQRTIFFGSKSIHVDEHTAMTVAAFNRGVIYLASQLAKLPWLVKNDDFSVIRNSNIAKLLI